MLAMYDVITEVPEVKIFSEKKICKSTPNGLKRVKKNETADPSAAIADDCNRRLPILRVECVNTRYHTTFHQNISINVACVQKRVLVP